MVVTGLVGSAEIADRTLNGPSQISPPGEDERLLTQAGFRLTRTEDATDVVARVAGDRHVARQRFRQELIAHEGEAAFRRAQTLYSTVARLAEERRLSRIVLVAEC
jgi:hypothetical protein